MATSGFLCIHLSGAHTTTVPQELTTSSFGARKAVWRDSQLQKTAHAVHYSDRGTGRLRLRRLRRRSGHAGGTRSSNAMSMRKRPGTTMVFAHARPFTVELDGIGFRESGAITAKVGSRKFPPGKLALSRYCALLDVCIERFHAANAVCVRSDVSICAVLGWAGRFVDRGRFWSCSALCCCAQSHRRGSDAPWCARLGLRWVCPSISRSTCRRGSLVPSMRRRACRDSMLGLRLVVHATCGPPFFVLAVVPGGAMPCSLQRPLPSSIRHRCHADTLPWRVR